MAIAPELLEAGEAEAGGSGGTTLDRWQLGSARRQQRLKPGGFGPRSSELRRQVQAARDRGRVTRAQREEIERGDVEHDDLRGRASRAARRSAQLGSAAARSTVRTTSSTVRSVVRATPTPSWMGNGTLAKIITAFFLGVLVLEAVSQATGKYFTWSLSNPLNVKPGSYVPLHGGGNHGPDVTALLTSPHVSPAPGAHTDAGVPLGYQRDVLGPAQP